MLGTLKSIRIDVSLNISGGMLFYDNDSSAAVSGTVEFGKVLNLYAPDVNLHGASNELIFDKGAVLIYNSTAFNLAADNGDGIYNYDSTPPDGSIFYGSDLSITETDYIGSQFWTKGTKGFIGTGTYNIVYSVNPWINFKGSNLGEIQFYSSPNVNSQGSVTVTYSYEAVPEPSILLLLSSGVLFLNKKNGNNNFEKKTDLRQIFLAF
jgi:hypothetical protein